MALFCTETVISANTPRCLASGRSDAGPIFVTLLGSTGGTVGMWTTRERCPSSPIGRAAYPQRSATTDQPSSGAVDPISTGLHLSTYDEALAVTPTKPVETKTLTIDPM